MHDVKMPAGDYTLEVIAAGISFFPPPPTSILFNIFRKPRKAVTQVRWLLLLFWLFVCFGVAAAGARWNRTEIPGWYRTLARPSFAPPDCVFGPVWTLLYLLMAVAAWRVSQGSPSTARNTALLLFAVQLGLNLAWSWIFFRKHAIGWALAEIAVLWISIGTTTLVFGRTSPLSAWLMVPYWVWVSFASILNAAFWKLNR